MHTVLSQPGFKEKHLAAFVIYWAKKIVAKLVYLKYIIKDPLPPKAWCSAQAAFNVTNTFVSD